MLCIVDFVPLCVYVYSLSVISKRQLCTPNCSEHMQQPNFPPPHQQWLVTIGICAFCGHDKCASPNATYFKFGWHRGHSICARTTADTEKTQTRLICCPYGWIKFRYSFAVVFACSTSSLALAVIVSSILCVCTWNREFRADVKRSYQKPISNSHIKWQFHLLCRSKSNCACGSCGFIAKSNLAPNVMVVNANAKRKAQRAPHLRTNKKNDTLWSTLTHPTPLVYARKHSRPPREAVCQSIVDP